MRKLQLFIVFLTMVLIPLTQSLAVGFDEIIYGGLSVAEQQELQRLNFQQSTMQSQIQNLNQELSGINYTVSNLTQELQQMKYSYQQAYNSYRETEQQVRRSQNELLRLKRQLDEARLRRQQQISLLQNQTHQFRSQLSSQSSTISNLERELQTIFNTRNPAAIPSLQSEIANLQSQKSKHQETYNRALTDLKKWDNVSEEDCKQSIVCFSQRMQARNMRDSAKSEMDKIDQQIAVKQKEINRLNNIERAYAAKQQEVNRAKQVLSQLNEQIARNEVELRRLQSEPLREEKLIEQEERVLRQAENRLPEQRQRVENIRYRLEDKERQLQDVTYRRESYVRQINEASYQLSSIQGRIAELNQKQFSQIVLVGSRLSFSVQQELLRLNAQMLMAESATAAATLYESRAIEAVVLVDTVFVSQLGSDVLAELTQFIRSSRTVTLVGDITALRARTDSAPLLALCSAPVITSVGEKRSCRYH